jgi:undecaprenyl-diphosphatase
LGRLLVGTLGVTFGHGLAFAAAVSACGVHVPILATVAVFLAGSAVGSASPTPGGLGALEAALVAGLAGVGAATAPAVAGVLAYRLITYWLPIIPGAVALHLLRPQTVVRT